MTVLYCVEPNSEASSGSSLFDETEDRQVVKYGFLLIVLDGRHQRNTVQMLNEEGGRFLIEAPSS